MTRILSRLLWIDCTGAGLVGVTVIALSDWLSGLEGLPRGVLLFSGVVNLVYGAYSFSLARRAERPMWGIRLLVGANLLWVPVCLGLVARFSAGATAFGYAHFVGEALYVGGLALLEWRYRHLLLRAA